MYIHMHRSERFQLFSKVIPKGCPQEGGNEAEGVLGSVDMEKNYITGKLLRYLIFYFLSYILYHYRT